LVELYVSTIFFYVGTNVFDATLSFDDFNSYDELSSQLLLSIILLLQYPVALVADVI